jgi:hypothetical protein
MRHKHIVADLFDLVVVHGALGDNLQVGRLQGGHQGVDAGTLVIAEQLAISGKCDIFQEIYGYEIELRK